MAPAAPRSDGAAGGLLRARWERWRVASSYPWLWGSAYLLWLVFTGGLVFGLIGVRPPGLALAIFAGLAVLPFAMLAVSHWMWRAYDPDRPR